MGAEAFHGRVRDGIGCGSLAMATRPPDATYFTRALGRDGIWCGCVVVWVFGVGVLVLRAVRPLVGGRQLFGLVVW